MNEISSNVHRPGGNSLFLARCFEHGPPTIAWAIVGASIFFKYTLFILEMYKFCVYSFPERACSSSPLERRPPRLFSHTFSPSVTLSNEFPSEESQLKYYRSPFALRIVDRWLARDSPIPEIILSASRQKNPPLRRRKTASKRNELYAAQFTGN